MVWRTSAQCIAHSKLLLLIKRQDMLKQPQTLCQPMVKKPTAVGGDTILTLACVRRHLVPDLFTLAFYHLCIYFLRLFNRESFTLDLEMFE